MFFAMQYFVLVLSIWLLSCTSHFCKKCPNSDPNHSWSLLQPLRCSILLASIQVFLLEALFCVTSKVGVESLPMLHYFLAMSAARNHPKLVAHDCLHPLQMRRFAIPPVDQIHLPSAFPWYSHVMTRGSTLGIGHGAVKLRCCIRSLKLLAMAVMASASGEPPVVEPGASTTIIAISSNMEVS